MHSTMTSSLPGVGEPPRHLHPPTQLVHLATVIRAKQVLPNPVMMMTVAAAVAAVAVAAAVVVAVRKQTMWTRGQE